jgi:DNA-directed RNA polymerase subunit RPC12/RpoP
MESERPPLEQLFIVCSQCGTPNFTGVALRIDDLERVRHSYRSGKKRCEHCNHEILFSEAELLPEGELSQN